MRRTQLGRGLAAFLFIFFSIALVVGALATSSTAVRRTTRASLDHAAAYLVRRTNEPPHSSNPQDAMRLDRILIPGPEDMSQPRPLVAGSSDIRHKRPLEPPVQANQDPGAGENLASNKRPYSMTIDGLLNREDPMPGAKQALPGPGPARNPSWNPEPYALSVARLPDDENPGDVYRPGLSEPAVKQADLYDKLKYYRLKFMTKYEEFRSGLDQIIGAKKATENLSNKMISKAAKIKRSELVAWCKGFEEFGGGLKHIYDEYRDHFLPDGHLEGGDKAGGMGIESMLKDLTDLNGLTSQTLHQVRTILNGEALNKLPSRQDLEKPGTLERYPNAHDEYNFLLEVYERIRMGWEHSRYERPRGDAKLKKFEKIQSWENEIKLHSRHLRRLQRGPPGTHGGPDQNTNAFGVFQSLGDVFKELDRCLLKSIENLKRTIKVPTELLDAGDGGPVAAWTQKSSQDLALILNDYGKFEKRVVEVKGGLIHPLRILGKEKAVDYQGYKVELQELQKYLQLDIEILDDLRDEAAGSDNVREVVELSDKVKALGLATEGVLINVETKLIAAPRMGKNVQEQDATGPEGARR